MNGQALVKASLNAIKTRSTAFSSQTSTPTAAEHERIQRIERLQQLFESLLLPASTAPAASQSGDASVLEWALDARSWNALLDPLTLDALASGRVLSLMTRSWLHWTQRLTGTTSQPSSEGVGAGGSALSSAPSDPTFGAGSVGGSNTKPVARWSGAFKTAIGGARDRLRDSVLSRFDRDRPLRERETKERAAFWNTQIGSEPPPPPPPSQPATTQPTVSSVLPPPASDGSSSSTLTTDQLADRSAPQHHNNEGAVSRLLHTSQALLRLVNRLYEIFGSSGPAAPAAPTLPLLLPSRL